MTRSTAAEPGRRPPEGWRLHILRGAPDLASAPAGALPPDVRELLWRLPAGQLERTAARFPHVLEAIARAWATPARMHATLDSLMFDERGGRSGFPIEVLQELGELRACYERWVGPRSTRGR